MSQLQQILNYVKNINERLNLWSTNAKKTEELPIMETMDPEGLLIASELVDGIWTSKQLEIQKIIDGISLDSQDNKVREVLLGTITTDHDLNYLLDNTGITVVENEIIVVTALATVNATLIQKQFLWKLGKGAFNPIGSANSNTKLIELQPRFLSEITANELTSSPSAIVYDFGVITDPILDLINTASPAYNYTDDEKIYYIRAIKDEVKLLYNFIGINGIYGNGASQMTEADLVLVYSSANIDITELLNNKLDKDGYTGTAKTLDSRILDLELPDGVIAIGLIVQVGSSVTIAANEFSVRTNQIEVFNTAFAGTIASATDLYIRTDIYEIDTAGIIYIHQGVEDLEIAKKPDVTAGRYEIGLVNINGATVSPAVTPPSGNSYIAKNEFNFTKLSGSGNKAQFTLFSEVTNVRVISASSIGSVSIDKKYIYPGKDHYVKNETGTTLIIKHNSGTGNYKYLFPNAADLVIPNNQIVHFKFRFDTGNNGFLDYVGGASGSGGVQLPIAITDVTGLTAELAAKALPAYVDSQDTAKLTEAKTYSDGLITQLINGAPADGNTLKELNDKILAVQAIIGGTTADGDALVNTVAELLAVFATFPEGVDLVTLLAGKVNTTDVYNALDCIVAGKVADARQVKVLNDLITTLRADVNSNTTAIGLRELSSNKSNDIETDKASTTKFGSVKALYDWAVGRFQQKLVAGTNIAIDNTNPLAPVISLSGGGSSIDTTKINYLNASLIDYTALGDSISDGYGSTNNKSYVNYIHDKVTFKSLNKIAVTSTTVMPSSGRPEIYTQIASIPAGTDLITLMIGVNDYIVQNKLGNLETVLAKNYASLDKTLSFAEAFRYNLETIRNNFPNAKILVITPIQTTQTGSIEFKSYIDIEIAIANYFSIPVIDAYNNSTIYKGSGLLPDGLHPNDAGYLLLADLVLSNMIAPNQTYPRNSIYNQTKNYIEVSTNLTLSEIHNQNDLLITANSSITIPNGLPFPFECTFDALAGVTLTFVYGSSVVVSGNVSNIMTDGLCVLKSRVTANNFRLKGAI
jgi:lysophospholipase L1-like esterase